MYQTQRTAPDSQGKKSSFFIYVGTFLGILLLVAFTSGVSFSLSAVLGRHTTAQTAPAPQPKHVQASLSIIINQPGMKKDWPAYRPSELIVPANSLVTLTITDSDVHHFTTPYQRPASG